LKKRSVGTTFSSRTIEKKEGGHSAGKEEENLIRKILPSKPGKTHPAKKRINGETTEKGRICQKKSS